MAQLARAFPPAEVFEASGSEQRILAERDIDALITYGYLIRTAERLIEPLDLFAEASDEAVPVHLNCFDAANAGTLLSAVEGSEDDGLQVSVQSLVTETLGDPVAISTQQIAAGIAADDAITSGELSILKKPLYRRTQHRGSGPVDLRRKS